MTIRTILVDDEKLAVQGLQLRLEPFDDVEIIDTCQNGREAIRAIKTQKPDLVFLDIQMPGFDGFSVVQGVMDVEPPLFVFVTAEESGLLGSQAFAERPTLPIRNLVAVLNMDVMNLYGRTKDISALGVDQSSLGGVFTSAAAAEGLRVTVDSGSLIRGSQPLRCAMRTPKCW